MGIKGDKTFEEIVERLVALFRPQPEGATATATADTGSRTSSSDPLDRPPALPNLPPTDEDAPN